MSSLVADAGLEARATNVFVTAHHLTVELEDGRMISVPLAWYPRLMHGTPAEWANFEISRFGIHWPDLDEDISVKSIILGQKSGESAKSIQRWLEHRARGEKEPVLTLPMPADLAKELEDAGN
jgi:hypothetical protein